MKHYPKLRPQLYDKKPDIENDDPTEWYKEGGLMARGFLRRTRIKTFGL